jgi:hypothetical protein
VVSVADCGGCGAACEVRPTVGEVVMGVVGMPPVAATFQTRICTRITRVRTNKQVDTVERMMQVILEVTVVVMGQGVLSQSPVNRSWFAT